ncbi:MAG: type IV pili methyl-accepting chemotaxis transducer N-terminal domain-containing protein [Planctomycetes bacterium]|nr:type IV pili methyl-accepting chemotaxis transducer N-terminal domain-containing protein [Planctomycetota bacterium]
MTRRAWETCGLVIVLAALLAPALAAAEDPPGSGAALALNLAARQRMLTQKATKEVLLLALEIDRAGNGARLAGTRDLFEATHRRLREGDAGMGGVPKASAGVATELAKVWQAWQQLRALIEQALGGEVDLAGVRRESAEILQPLDALVAVTEAEVRKGAPGVAARAVNLAGRQRMLSQKMTKEMLLIALRHEVEPARKGLKAAAALFEKTLKGLSAGDPDLGLEPCVDPGVLAKLRAEEAAWTDFQLWVEKGDFMIDYAAKDVEAILAAGDRLLDAADQATTAFQGLRRP